MCLFKYYIILNFREYILRILHITGQKPNSTGSGVYMSGLIESLNKLGHEQGVIAGIDIKDDKECFGEI